MNTYDLLGIGIGPSNLSTAALLYPHRDEVRSIFFDEKEEFSWYPGMLFPEATIQVSILKDLVTMIDPTSQFSFFNFLKASGRLYLFASKGKFDNLKRREFVQYFKWVVDKLPNLVFSSRIEQVQYADGFYDVRIQDKAYKAKNLVMGIGLTAYIPECCKPYVGSSVVHSSQFLTSNVCFDQKRLLVVGGGQSGAEVILHLLKDEDKAPASIAWVCSNYNFMPLENTPFSNELYTPGYSDYFYKLHEDDKKLLLEKQKFTSDGVSEKTLDDIYETIYQYKILREVDILDFYVGSYLTRVDQLGRFVSAAIVDKVSKIIKETINVDIIILATGFRYQIPKCLDPLLPYLSITEGKFNVANDYSIISDGRLDGKVFLHNGAKHVRGVADPNLSLIAWRSGKIINSLVGKNLYDTDTDKSIINWNR